MKKTPNIEWLMESSGPIIRYRTIAELHPFTSTRHREDAIQELLGCSEVKKWLELLADSSHLHGSDSHAFENSLAKLSAYGVRADIANLSDVIQSTYSRIHCSEMENVVVYPFFVSIGFTNDQNVSAYAQSRLETVYRYAKKYLKNFSNDDDITDLLLSRKEKEELHIPSKWNDKHVWKPYLNFLIPNCYDFYLFSHMEGYEEKRAAVLRFINTPKFQRLCEIREFERSYGWDSQKGYCWSTWEMPYFHGYNGFDTDRFTPNKFLLYLDLTSKYPNANDITWFKDGLTYLERYKTKTGHYKFPSGYLPERTNGYYLYTGARMRLGEVGQDGLEIESTFRMERMKKSLSKQTGIEPNS